MNKKRLSVVMAGAMLATSVAPVLAAETTGTEIAYDQLATFKSDILAKMAEKKISTFEIFKTAGFVSSDIATELSGNATGEFSSAFGVKITGKDGVVKLDTTYTTAEVKAALENLTAGDKVEVFERDTVDFYGQVLPGKNAPAKTSSPVKYTEGANGDFDTANLNDTKENIFVFSNDNADSKNKLVKTIVANGTDAGATKLIVTLNKLTNIKDDTSNEIIELTQDNTKIDGRLAFDEKGNLLDVTKSEDVQKFDHFGELVSWKASAEEDNKGAELKDTYTIGEKPADETKETLKVSDLFDGIALTARGTEILSDLTNAKTAAEDAGIATNKALVRLDGAPGAVANGISKFTVSYYNSTEATKATKTITITATTQEEANGLYKLLNSGEFQVGIVAGQNRYETAVNVAKAAGSELYIEDANGNGELDSGDLFNKNIVIVNGDSLVDGLAAAPLAASLNQISGTATSGKTLKQAPVLLSKTDELPTATKEYLEELAADYTVKQRKAFTVNLVGGDAVLSNSLVEEIKAMGFKVERFGGENREETSIAVAKALPATKKAFVVGATGEADAMSISAVAADKTKGEAGTKVTPIIVSSVHGLTNDSLDYLRKATADDITIVGGTSVVTEAEENKINNSLNGVRAERLAGSNRFETNNKIIEKFYAGSAEGLVVVKDGVAKKSELVDALSAANYAAANKAPILLATSTVTNAQKTTLLKAKNGTFTKLAQVGMGSDRTVLETLSDLLDITNKYL